MSDAQRDRLLGERALALAARGRALVEPDGLPPHLVCESGGRFYALPVELVSAVRPFAAHPVPLSAAREGGMLGVAEIGAGFVSVLDLAGLLGEAPVPSAEDDDGGGSMLLLRGGEPPVALRVRRVTGVGRLRPAGEPDRALLDTLLPEAADRSMPALAVLLTRTRITAAIRRLDAR